MHTLGIVECLRKRCYEDFPVRFGIAGDFVEGSRKLGCSSLDAVEVELIPVVGFPTILIQLMPEGWNAG